MVKNEETIYERIEKKGIRLTPQRKDIIRILIENNHKHLSASDIYDSLKEENKIMGLATVYRTLDLLTKMGMVMKRDFDSELSHYELVIDQVNHHHLICKNCLLVQFYILLHILLLLSSNNNMNNHNSYS